MSFVPVRIPSAPGTLDPRRVAADPIEQFRRWFAEAEAAGFLEPAAMTLATATRQGVVAARMVLLRGVDERGFAFFTNYTSRKAEELADNPRAALVFYWDKLERQVRIVGTVVQSSLEESDAYFRQRPRGSQLAAWASNQSQPITDRAGLEAEWHRLDQQYATVPVPLPPFWGGYRVVPVEIEFWQGQPNRLHDRVRYRQSEDGWVIERLAP